MGYLSKGVRRLLWGVVALLLVLASPAVVGGAWGQTMRGLGVPDAWSVFALIGLAILPFALAVGWVGHKIAFAIFGKKTVAQLVHAPKK